LPKLFFPTVVIATDSFKAFISMLVVGIFLFYSGFFINPAYITLPLLLLVQLLFIMAIGYILAAITPYFPDLSIIVSLVLRAMFFLSGIFYDPQRIPEEYLTLFFMNPMARFINDYRGILMDGRLPEIEPLLILGLISLLIIFLTNFFITRHETEYPRIVSQ
jgi:lipopolysaccharide transport system permease protein